MIMEQSVIISNNLKTELATALSECEHDRLFVLADDNTAGRSFGISFVCEGPGSSLSLPPTPTRTWSR